MNWKYCSTFEFWVNLDKFSFVETIKDDDMWFVQASDRGINPYESTIILYSNYNEDEARKYMKDFMEP